MASAATGWVGQIKDAYAKATPAVLATLSPIEQAAVLSFLGGGRRRMSPLASAADKLGVMRGRMPPAPAPAPATPAPAPQ